ncbi:5640_t:CDS:2 [Paraglomus occultum]|uniref:5640_t:CDS:1 n=1 Tax=Paraglomus occultum TaxID=144539 RepID=A0A9N8VEH7_9GLOM|nr:5640_t:CDS:2 [Paraglomus occultum]
MFYRILGFEQSPWLEPYIAMNTQRRAKAKNAFEKDFWKLMNNSVFGKTMEDVRKRVNIELIHPAFVSRKIFYGANLVAVHRRQTNVKLNKPEYVGACILDLSKYFMYDFWYEIETENIYQDMIDDCDLFDFSDYPEDHWDLDKFCWINKLGIKKFQPELQKDGRSQAFEFYKLELEQKEKERESRERYSDNEEFQGYINIDQYLWDKYYKKLFETAKNK